MKNQPIESLRAKPPNPIFVRWIRVLGTSAWLFGLLLLALILPLLLHGVLSR